MWKSEDDVLRDIASLNDFGALEDKESYKILYSVGRGLKTKEKPKISEKFIDTRTGEAIHLEDPGLETSNAFCKSKGRGSALGSLFRAKVQLQQQLRLARPLGSGDEAIESYYRKNCRTTETAQNSMETPDLKPSGNPGIPSEDHNNDPNSNKLKKRVIATRNSSSQVNALISNLLSKNQIYSNTSMEQNSADDIKEKQLVFSSNKGEKCVRNPKVQNRSFMSDLNFSDLSLSSKANSSVKNNLDYFKEHKSKVPREEQPEDEETFKKLTSEERKKRNEDSEDFRLNINGCNTTESENDRDLKYRALGERLNRLREIRSNIEENGIHDSLSEYSVSTESISFEDEDFPPLRKI